MSNPSPAEPVPPSLRDDLQRLASDLRGCLSNSPGIETDVVALGWDYDLEALARNVREFWSRARDIRMRLPCPAVRPPVPSEPGAVPTPADYRNALDQLLGWVNGVLSSVPVFPQKSALGKLAPDRASEASGDADETLRRIREFAERDARLNALRERYWEWRRAAQADLNIIYSALNAMHDCEMASRREQRVPTPDEWIPHLREAGAVFARRGWLDLLSPRLRIENQAERFGYDLLAQAATCPDNLPLLLGELLATGWFHQFTWQHIYNSLGYAAALRVDFTIPAEFHEYLNNAQFPRVISSPAEPSDSEAAPPVHRDTDEGVKPPADTTRRPRHPNQPSRDKQDDILATIRGAKTPLQRAEIMKAMKQKREGKLGGHLAWMCKEGILINIPQRGYWPAGEPLPQ